MSAFSYSSSYTLVAGPTTVMVPAALSLPVVETQFPRHRHPYWPKLQETARAWILEKRLMPPDKVERYADALCYTDLIAGYYVGAPDEVLTAISDFSTWFFFWDDRHDRDAVHGRVEAWRTLRSRLHEALESPGSHLHHADPLVAAFADCVARLFSYLSRQWNMRFADHFHAVIDAYDDEFDNRRTETVPGVQTYIELRRHTFGHWIWADLLEITAQYELPAAVRDIPAYRRAVLASQDFSAWYNDLCSLPKEMAAGDVHNLGISLIRHEGLSLEESVAEVHRRVAGCVTEFLATEQKVLRIADDVDDGGGQGTALSDGIKFCLFNLRNWFSSVYWFHHESGRYRVDSWDDRSTPPYVSDLAGGE